MTVATVSSFDPTEHPSRAWQTALAIRQVPIGEVMPAKVVSVDLPLDIPTSIDAGTGDGGDLERSARAGLMSALAPLVTDVMPTLRALADEAAPPPSFAPTREQSSSSAAVESRRRALQRAVAELAQTHAVAADLASRATDVDLPLDVPDLITSAIDASTDAAQALGEARKAAKLALIVPDMIRACRDRVAIHASPGDRMKIDIVATLFDHVLTDDRVPTAVRNTLARLQLPVLRIALGDDSFFASRTHPTRRLLDRMAAAAVQWNFATEAGRASRAELERVVYAVIQGSSDDAGAHARLLEEFERNILAINDAARVTTRSAITDPEDRDVLVIKATIQISQLLAGAEIDRAIRFFLLDVWSRVLVEIACRDADSVRDATLARAKRLCFDLAWSTAPKTTSGERARLAGLLPTMIAALRDGMAMIEYPQEDRQRFFAQWTRALYVATKRSHLVHDGRHPQRPDDPIPSVDLDIDVFVRRLREGSFGVEPMRPRVQRAGAGNARASPDGLRSLADDTPSLLKTDTSGERRGSGKRKPLSDVRPVMSEMTKGAWFELRDAKGFARVRLSWISPLRSFYLFIGADSALTRSFDPAALAELIERGDLRAIVP
ncbi:MAG: DUF1631 family protein [Luteibacter sp.]